MFKGNTEKTLGYFNINCKPVKGKKVRIQLLLPSVSTSINETEVSGKKLDDGVIGKKASEKGSLSIIEAELYEIVSLKK